jgi:hypothetical protein
LRVDVKAVKWVEPTVLIEVAEMVVKWGWLFVDATVLK